MNVDKVYQVEHFVRMGETIHATGFQQNVGGKRLNQSVAASVPEPPCSMQARSEQTERS